MSSRPEPLLSSPHPSHTRTPGSVPCLLPRLSGGFASRSWRAIGVCAEVGGGKPRGHRAHAYTAAARRTRAKRSRRGSSDAEVSEGEDEEGRRRLPSLLGGSIACNQSFADQDGWAWKGQYTIGW